MELELSVVVPTFNRAQVIKQVLIALFNQTLEKERFEIIVVDDGSVDQTADMLAEFRNETEHNLKVYRQSNKFAGSARNLGIKKAKSSTILLMDDDIVPNDDLLKQHLDMHFKYPENEVVVLGHYITGDTGVDLCHPDNRMISHYSITCRGDPLVDAGYFATAIVSLKKNFIMEAGLFHPGLPYEQDMELAFRLKKKGLKLIYCKEATGIHIQPMDTIEKVIKNGRKCGKTLAEYYDKIPHFQMEFTNLGARLNGGWNQAFHDPLTFFKDGVRRWAINCITIGLIVKTANRLPITNPPSRMLVRFSKEIWSYYYRSEFKRNRT